MVRARRPYPTTPSGGSRQVGTVYMQREGSDEVAIALIDKADAAANALALRRALELLARTSLAAVCEIRAPAPSGAQLMQTLQDWVALRGNRTGLSLVVPAASMPDYLALGADLAADGVVLGIFTDCEQAYAAQHAVSQWALGAPRRAAAQLAAALLQRPAGSVQEAHMPYLARLGPSGRRVASPG
jgi:hypothetical protein